MSNPDRYKRIGELVPVTPEQVAWANGLLVNQNGLVRNLILSTYGPDGEGRLRPRNTLLASAIHRVDGGPLRHVWVSRLSAIHTLHILDDAEAAQATGKPAVAEVGLDVGDQSSTNVTLQMRAEAREVPEEGQQEAVAILAAILNATSQRAATIEVTPEFLRATGRRMFEAIITRATIQGPRVHPDGSEAQDGHPIVDLELLAGHQWPDIQHVTQPAQG